MRKFLLQNEYGEQINLQGGNIFLYAPEGLGFEENVDYMQFDPLQTDPDISTAIVEDAGIGTCKNALMKQLF